MSQYLSTMLFSCGMIWAVGAQSAEISLCSVEPGIISTKLLPMLESGLGKTLIVAEACRGERYLLKSLAVRKNLWRREYSITPSGGSTVLVSDTVQFEKALCDQIRFVDEGKCHQDEDDHEVYVVVNPTSKAVDKVMQAWVEKNAGIYRSIGVRIRWSTLKGADQYERLIYRGRPRGK